MEAGLPGANGLSAASPAVTLVRRRGTDTANFLNHNTEERVAKEMEYRQNHAQRQAVEWTAAGLNGRRGRNAASVVAMEDSLHE
jgi:hypothetical protein